MISLQLAQLLKVEIVSYDPIHCSNDLACLSALQIRNSQALAFTPVLNSLYCMFHCDFGLYCKILELHWEKDLLDGLCIVGNSFMMYDDPKKHEGSSLHLLLPFVREFPLNLPPGRLERGFNNTVLMFFDGKGAHEAGIFEATFMPQKVIC